MILNVLLIITLGLTGCSRNEKNQKIEETIAAAGEKITTDKEQIMEIAKDMQEDTSKDTLDIADENGNESIGNVKDSLGSDTSGWDSDNDGSLDDIEFWEGISSIMPDTDGNGISDYDEHRMKQIDAIYDAETNMYTAYFSADTMGIPYDPAVIPSIKLVADAKGILNFELTRVENDLLFNPSMVGYIGAAYDISTKGNMISAELTFTYDENMIDEDIKTSSDFCPTIYCYNFDEDMISEVEGQVWNGNQVSVELDHFSTYILINKSDLEKFWNEPINY